MPILIFTARPELRTNQRLQDAARELGVELDLVDATTVVASHDRLFIRSRDLLDPPPQAIMARVGNWRPESLLGVLEVAERAGIPMPNPAPAIRRSRDHWRTLERLRANGLPVPDALIGADPEILAAVASERLSYPVVVKTRDSRMGIGVILCQARDQLQIVLDSLWRLGHEIVVQRFVECAGVSLRLLVLDGEIVAAARFVAQGDEWRSNAARGASCCTHHPTAEEAELALGAAEALGLGLCGVDLLPGRNGTVIAEANPTPGFFHLEEASGIDVASAIIRSLSRL